MRLFFAKPMTLPVSKAACPDVTMALTHYMRWNGYQLN